MAKKAEEIKEKETKESEKIVSKKNETKKVNKSKKDVTKSEKNSEIKEEKTEIKDNNKNIVNKSEKPVTTKKKKGGLIVFIIFLMLVLVAGLGLTIAYFVSPYTLVLNGDKEMSILINEPFEEPGAVVKRFIFVTDKPIEVNGDLDTSKLGNYKLVYSYDNMTVIRTIHVVNELNDNQNNNGQNTEGPKILFTSDDQTLILNANSTYDIFEGIGFLDSNDGIIEDDDVEVIDNIDITQLGEYEVKYKACNKYNKCTEITRKVEVKDLEAPKISLNRPDLKIPVGNTYNEYGATAIDNYDQYLGDIKIESNVDTSKEGTYEVKYSICDSSNNCSEKIRKVTVFKQETKETNANTTSSIISGNFKSHPSIDGTYPSSLSLKSSNKSGTIVINKCEGTDTISGSYSVSGSTLTLKLSRAIDPGQPSVLKFTIINNNTLRLDTDITSCSPWKGEKFTRV